MPDRRALIERAILLSWLTIAYNLVEGAVSVYFGVADDSTALAGFGADSFIEVFSAALVLWRFRAEEGVAPGFPVERERRATMGIGVLFSLLAAGTAAGALAQLLSGGRPATTWPGVVISAASLSFMFYLWRAKLRVARELDSCTALKDADCSLACIKLSGVLLAGSAVFAAVPALWWADSAAALVLALFIAREGAGTIRAARRPDFAGGCGCA
jgi:divalent metal cation (Fe/Co/Zn/Cd) transporter